MKQSFHALLELYVFNVATNFIESASPEDQNRLVNLLNTIDKPFLDNENYTVYPEELSKTHLNHIGK
ncbi:hypothetical protein SAMN05216167_103170 [Spirosoma endophyticum]|uniref:Uncharacterized protein n=1 Tax=Spirosoma endophyticum TaxID=662367 RepID=A0A1I1P9A0_9BACT|nr:hypothetical protein SAMN05216167_103170 [Spirosoma endophyticum]